MRRIVYVLLGLVVLLFVAAFVGLRALGTETGRTRIAGALSTALGQPVTIGDMSLSLLPTPTLRAGSIHVGAADSGAARSAAGAPGIALAGLTVVPTISSFLPGRTPTISRVELVGLTVSVLRDPAGHWHLPVPPASAAPKSGAPGAAPASTAFVLGVLRVRNGAIRVVDESLHTAAGAPTITTISDIGADLHASGGAVSVPQFTGRLGGTTVTGSAEASPRHTELRLASESIRDADVAALFGLAGLAPYPGLSFSGKAPFEMTTTVGSDLASLAVNGKAAVERVRLGTLTLEGLQANFRLSNGTFMLDPITFAAYGGRQRGTVTIALAKPPAGYAIRTALDGLDINQALSANTTMKDFLTGTGRLSADVRGRGNEAAAIQRSLSGTVKFELKDGVLRGFPLVSAVNHALGLTGGDARDTKYDVLSGSAVIAGGKARTDDLLMKAGDLAMTGKGVLGFDRTLDFRLNAGFSAAKSAELASKVGALRQMENGRGEISVPVTVTGTTTAPKTSVDVGSMAKAKAKEEVKKGLLKLFQKH
ncbi:MAG TPA: AsmA-like C-terminal region-containing protein [Gemmatimonadales bacterium]|nr:AsmA-like C-terminal region-containing protein [Gemmatimonadales bacterium]